MSQDERIETAIKVWGVKLGTPLSRNAYTRAHVYDIDPKRGYVACLIGPLFDLSNPDIRLWVNDRTLDGRRTMSLRVQDHDDDVILNQDAVGVERYHIGDIWLNPVESSS